MSKYIQGHPFYLWIAGNDADKISALECPPFRLTRQLRCSEQVSKFGNKDLMGSVGLSHSLMFKQHILLIPGFPDSTFQPWQILCKESDYLDAVVWALSDYGGRLWQETNGDIYIVDPHGQIEGNDLMTKLLGRDWTKDNISESQIHAGPCKDKGQFYATTIFKT